MKVAVSGLGNLGVPIAERRISGLVLGFAGELGTRLPMTTEPEGLLADAVEAGYAVLDFTTLFLRLRAHANAQASSQPTRPKA